MIVAAQQLPNESISCEFRAVIDWVAVDQPPPLPAHRSEAMLALTDSAITSFYTGF
jgi:hypothetical protein